MRIRLASAAAPVLAAALLAAPASAADYLRGTQVEVPPPAAPALETAFDWTGFYFGGHAGYSETLFRTDRGVADLANGLFNGYTALSEITALVGPAGVGQYTLSPLRNGRGSVYGGFAGYNMAFGDAVVGIEGEYTLVGDQTLGGSVQQVRLSSGDVTVGSRQEAKLKDYVNARIRLGYAYGRIMPYFTAGFAAGRFDTNVLVTADWTSAASNYTTSYNGFPRQVGGKRDNVWGYGFSVGGGVEAALIDNLIVRAEYLYTRFNNVDGITIGTNQARVGAAVKF